MTAHDILRVIKKWIAPIFDPETSIGAVASGLAKQEDIAQHFEKIGYKVDRRSFGQDGDESGSEESGSESGSDSDGGH